MNFINVLFIPFLFPLERDVKSLFHVDDFVLLSRTKITATSGHTRGVISDHSISYTFICITIKASESVSMVMYALIEKE